MSKKIKSKAGAHIENLVPETDAIIGCLYDIREGQARKRRRISENRSFFTYTSPDGLDNNQYTDRITTESSVRFAGQQLR